MRVALVSPYDYAYPGGVTEHVRHLGGELLRLGHEVTVVAPSSAGEPSPTPGFRRIGGVVGLPANGSAARLCLSLRAGGRVARLLRRGDYDVVHLHEPLLPTVPLLALHSSPAVNVGTFHACWGSDRVYRWARCLLGRSFARLDGLIAVSPAARRFVGQQFPGDYAVIPNGVDGRRFSPAVPPLPALRDGKQNVLFVGRLEGRKGLRHLIRACSLLRRRDLRLVVVGPGSERALGRYREAARAAGVDALFAGYVPPALLPAYYASADVCCAPAVSGESFGIVLLEAMASGRCLVASDIEGYRSVVGPGEAGQLVPPGDAAALAGALGRLLEDGELRAELGRRGLARARDFAWPAIAGRVAEVYRRAAERPARRGRTR